jgi:hypothetical protein
MLPSSPAPGRRGGAPPLLWTLAAALLFLAAIASIHWGVWRRGLDTAVGYTSRGIDGAAQPGFSALNHNDAIFVTGLVARNAHVLAHEPWNLFDAEHCAPALRTLTYGDPMLTMGALGAPLRLALGDPVETYNAVVALLPWLAALAMYGLVWDWTRVASAGIVAGLLYAFQAGRLWDASHPFLYDTTWTVLGLFFARRLLAWGRWRDAIGLGLSGALQLGAGLYPVIGALLLALPMAVWLARTHGLRRAGAARLALATGLVLASAALLFTPFLETRAATPTLKGVSQLFAGTTSYLPGGLHFPGWLCLALGLAAFAPWGAGAWFGVGRDPRWALLAGVGLVAWGAGGDALAPLPNLYGALSEVLPGLDAVRAPGRAATAAQLALSILAGIAAAALVGRVPLRARPAVGGALVLLAVLTTLPTPSVSWGETRAFDPLRVRPQQPDLDLFGELSRRGNTGPLFEIPMDWNRETSLRFAPKRILMAAYHHRRTSACYGAFRPPGRQRLGRIAAALPAREAVQEARGLGFTTLVVHHPTRERARSQPLVDRLDAEARRENGTLRHLGATPGMDVYELRP